MLLGTASRSSYSKLYTAVRYCSTSQTNTELSTSSSSAKSSKSATVADYDALLRRLLPFQKSYLDEFLLELQTERKVLERLTSEFDEKLRKMEAVREEIRCLAEKANSDSLRRRDELLELMRRQSSTVADSTALRRR